MLPQQIGNEIAQRSYAAASGAGLRSAHYPAPGSTPAVPSLVVLWDGFDVSEANEQIWIHRFRGLLFTALNRIEAEIALVDALVTPIVDAFSPNANPGNYHLGGGVDFCMLERAELSIPLSYNAVDHYGGRLFWRVKARRFAGGTS